MRSQRNRYRRAAYALAILALLDAILWYLVAVRVRPGGELTLAFLNVGQGDSSLIEIPNGREPIQILIDGGPDASVLRELGKILPPSDRYLDLLVMTHPQLDHFAGFLNVLERYDVGAFVSPGRRGETGAYRELADLLAAGRVPYVVLTEGDAIRAGDSELAAFGPSPQERLSGELNNSSLVLMLSSGDLRALYTADIGADVEQRLTRDYDLRAHILKVPHHGSRFSSSEAFLAEVQPAVAMIEVGTNTYGHPTPAALERLASVKARVFRTDADGTVRAVFRGGTIELFTGGIDKGSKGSTVSH